VNREEGLVLPDENYNSLVLSQALVVVGHITFAGVQESESPIQSFPDLDPYESVSAGVIDQEQMHSEEYQIDFMQKAIEAEKEKRRKAALTEIKDRELRIFRIKPNEKLCNEI
jgi:hypothetical protein